MDLHRLKHRIDDPIADPGGKRLQMLAISAATIKPLNKGGKSPGQGRPPLRSILGNQPWG
jgi:hypothetical protein